MVNIKIKPQYGNRGRGVEDETVRKKIEDIVLRLITE